MTYILFDLDGTITDPMLGITNSAIYALGKYGYEGLKNEDLKGFIGPPLKDSFMQVYDFSEKQAVEAIDYFRDYFKDKGIYENIPYPGIEDLLKDLKTRGFKLAVATSKPTPFAVQILEYFKLDGYFDFIGGSKMDNTRTAKAEVITYVLDNLAQPDKSEVIMIGDRKHDIIGAKTLGIKGIGVLYGYGSKEELEGAEADYIVKSVEDLQKLLKRL